MVVPRLSVKVNLLILNSKISREPFEAIKNILQNNNTVTVSIHVHVVLLVHVHIYCTHTVNISSFR